jgi:hypothetical protein
MEDDRDRDLVRRAAKLRREAGAVLGDLGLLALLSPLGRTEVVGSAAVGLALTRDIDLDTICPSLDPAAVWDALRPLTGHPRVKKLRWSDERGRFNSLGRPDSEGLYLGVHCYPAEVSEDQRWKLDCWFFAEDAPRPDIAIRDRLLAATDDERLAILRLKDVAMRAGRYGPSSELQGFHIYQAVLDRGVRRFEDL